MFMFMFIIAYAILIIIIITSIFYSVVYTRYEYYANVPEPTSTTKPVENINPDDDIDFDPDADQDDSTDVDDMDYKAPSNEFESPKTSISTKTVNDPPSVLTNQYQCEDCAEEYAINCDDATTNINDKQAQCNSNCVYYSAEDHEIRSCIPACYAATHPSESASARASKKTNKPIKCNIRGVINIYIIGPSPDAKTTLSVSPQYTITDVKNEIRYKMGIPFLKQKLVLGNMLLDNNKTLEYYSITENMTLNLTPVRSTIHDCYQCANRMRKKTLDECYNKCQYFNYENNQNMPCDAACNFKISKHTSRKKEEIKPLIAK